MCLSELQSKDIVNLKDGKKIGNLIDIVVSNDGRIKSIIVEQTKKMRVFNTGEDIEISWQQIEKIGEDVILVKLLN